MDGQRFDALTRAFATISRRQVVKALAGGMTSGLLALFSSQDAGAAFCRGQPDFTPCGECKHCRNGRCVAGFDGLACGVCGTCQDGHCRGDDRRCGECQRCRDRGNRCVPDRRQDLHPCGTSGCHVCDGASGTCDPVSDGSDCLTGNGICCGGICRDTRNDATNCGGCHNICPPCWRCEGERCVPDRGADGQPCPGTESCGTCFNGECLVDVLRCPNPCTVCDAETLTCVPRSEGASCRGECGTCQGGQCLPNGGVCLRTHGACWLCDGETMTCVAADEGEPCGGECGACHSGQCLPSGGRCSEQHGTCSACDAETLTCTVEENGAPCGLDGQVCCDGECVGTQTDNSNCGACGNACTDGQSCINGTCQCSGFQDGCRPFEMCQNGTCVAVCPDTSGGGGIHNGTFYACQTETGVRCGCNGCDTFCHGDLGFACCTDGCQSVFTTCAQEGH